MGGKRGNDGLLYKNDKVIVPEQMRRIVLYLAHGEGLSHEGETATAKKLKGLYWPGKKEDIKRWVQTCKCAGAKLQRRPDGVNKIFDSYRALQCLVVDYMVDTIKHSREAKSERYTLVMVDRATGFCRMAMTKTRTAAATAQAINEHWIADFGCPEEIQSDNEGAMKSELTKYLCRARWMAKLRCSHRTRSQEEASWRGQSKMQRQK